MDIDTIPSDLTTLVRKKNRILCSIVRIKALITKNAENDYLNSDLFKFLDNADHHIEVNPHKKVTFFE